MKSRRASRRSSAEPRLLKAASDAASSQRRRVGRKTIAGNKLYELSAASKFAGGISGMRNFIGVCNLYAIDASARSLQSTQRFRDSVFHCQSAMEPISCQASGMLNAAAPAARLVG